jgi:hypothetical protein
MIHGSYNIKSLQVIDLYVMSKSMYDKYINTMYDVNIVQVVRLEIWFSTN